MGLSASLGPCMAHQSLILLPYVGVKGSGVRESLLEAVRFFGARLLSHALLGAVAGGTGSLLFSGAGGSLISTLAVIGLGVLLALAAVAMTLSHKTAHCSRGGSKASARGRSGGLMLLAGSLTTLFPCPFLVAVIGYSASTGSLLQGGVLAAAFALGSGLSPILILTPLIGSVREVRLLIRFSRLLRYVGGFLLFGYGVHLVAVGLRLVL